MRVLVISPNFLIILRLFVSSLVKWELKRTGLMTDQAQIVL